MKKTLTLLFFILISLNIVYLLRGFFVFPYPTGDGLTRWLFVGKLIHFHALHQTAPPGAPYPYRDDYPLLVPFIYNLFLNLNLSFAASLLVFFLPYLLLIFLIFYISRHYRFSIIQISLLALPILTLPLLEQMSGRGMVGFIDHFLAVFIAASLLFAAQKQMLPATIFALLAAHTKNEGQLFSFLFLLFYFRRSPLIWLIPLNLLSWRLYLYTQHLSWFYLTTPSTPLSLSLIISRFPLLANLTLHSLLNPYIFSLATPVLLFSLLAQCRPTRPQLLLLFLALLYLLTFASTPTSLDLSTHFAVAVDRLNLHLLIPYYLLTIPQLLYNWPYEKNRPFAQGRSER